MSVYLSLYLATFATLGTEPLCLSVFVACNLCNPWKHTSLAYLSLYLATLPNFTTIPVYLSLYLAVFAIKTVRLPESVPRNPCNQTCLPVSVPRKLCNIFNYTCLSICPFTSYPLQLLQPYLSVYMSLYLATFAILAIIPVCLALYLATFGTIVFIPVFLCVSVPCNL